MDLNWNVKGAAFMWHRRYFLFHNQRNSNIINQSFRRFFHSSLKVQNTLSVTKLLIQPTRTEFQISRQKETTRLNFNYLSSTLINFHFGFMLGRGWAPKLGHKRLRELICIICQKLRGCELKNIELFCEIVKGSNGSLLRHTFESHAKRYFNSDDRNL